VSLLFVKTTSAVFEWVYNLTIVNAWNLLKACNINRTVWFNTLAGYVFMVI